MMMSEGGEGGGSWRPANEGERWHTDVPYMYVYACINTCLLLFQTLHRKRKLKSR